MQPEVFSEKRALEEFILALFLHCFGRWLLSQSISEHMSLERIVSSITQVKKTCPLLPRSSLAVSQVQLHGFLHTLSIMSKPSSNHRGSTKSYIDQCSIVQEPNLRKRASKHSLKVSGWQCWDLSQSMESALSHSKLQWTQWGGLRIFAMRNDHFTLFYFSLMLYFIFNYFDKHMEI